MIDLSVAVNENTPAYPGDPKISIEILGTFDKDTYNDHKVSFGIHSSGTHIDAPLHMVKDGKSLDQIPIEKFVGRGRLIKVDGVFDIESVKNAKIEEADIVLFHTGMAEAYGQDDKYYGDSRPEMTEEIANYLVEKKIKMIGLDMCSPDKEPFPVHRILLGNEILIIENMTNLNQLEDKEFTVYALPINLQLDGAPARVIAEINEP
jgi:kynurenine formamidase